MVFVAMPKMKRQPMVKPPKARFAAYGLERQPYELQLQLRRLNSANIKIREDAIRKLRKMKHPAAVPELLRALRSKNVSTRVVASFALGEFGRVAEPGLIKALKVNRPRSISGLAADALGKMKSNAAVPKLLDVLRHRGPEQISIIYALGRIGNPAAVPALLEELRGKNPFISSSAAEALGKIGNRAAVPGLLKALESESGLVRICAIGALSNFVSEAGVIDSIKATAERDPDETLRNAAKRILEHIARASR